MTTLTAVRVTGRVTLGAMIMGCDIAQAATTVATVAVTTSTAKTAVTRGRRGSPRGNPMTGCVCGVTTAPEAGPA
eukprot:scaffold64618_cov54-Phaeocystis_antarctica.AAC.10